VYLRTPAGVQYEFARLATEYVRAAGGDRISVKVDTMKRPHQIQPLRGWLINWFFRFRG
jgi:hypothetical protein